MSLMGLSGQAFGWEWAVGAKIKLLNIAVTAIRIRADRLKPFRVCIVSTLFVITKVS
jgi:hypothetical protein